MSLILPKDLWSGSSGKMFVIALAIWASFAFFAPKTIPEAKSFDGRGSSPPDNPVCRIFCAYFAANGKAYTILPNVAGKHQRFVRLQNRSQMDLVE